MINKSSFKEFITYSEAREWGDKNYGALVGILATGKTHNSLTGLLDIYSAGKSIVYNRFLRGAKIFEEFEKREIEEISKEIQILEEGIREYELAESIIVYRYTRKEPFKSLLFKCTSVKGKTFTEKGFMSTTLVKNQINEYVEKHHYNCILKLHLPKGTKGVHFKCNNSVLDELEFLLPPNSKFVVTKKSLNYKLWPVYHCYLIN